MNEAGTSLLEAAAAVVMAGLLLTAANVALRASAATQAQIGRRSKLLAVARNLLEAEIAAPCTTVAPCPPELRCSLQRRPYGSPAGGVYEIVAVVGGQKQPLRLSVLSRRDGPCGRLPL